MVKPRLEAPSADLHIFGFMVLRKVTHWDDVGEPIPPVNRCLSGSAVVDPPAIRKPQRRPHVGSDEWESKGIIM